MARKIIVKRRFNKDGTISLVSRGRVIFKSRDMDAIQSFTRGFLGAA